MANLGQRIAASAALKAQLKGFDPFMALLRVSFSPDAVPILRQALNAQVIAPLAARLTGDNPLERAVLIGALLTGFDIATRILGLTETAILEALHQTLSESIQRLVDLG